ncbi:alkane 1-monooxygenase [Ekhidna sp.]|uniref:alkane 1-monooxygenase n=1 Tax=Ekhidna sp. TaxID=2608089 RepID=UPI003BAC6EA0
MRLKWLKYLAVYSVPLAVLCSIYFGGWFSYSAIIYAFGLIPFFELLTSGSIKNMDKAQEEIVRKDRVYDYLLYGLVPTQLFILGYFLFRISVGGLETYELVGMTLAYGVACGVAINNAHELGHRSNRHEQFLSKILLMTSLYMHFFIEHNRGHHRNVATKEDPASSRYGEIIYAFYLRTVKDGWLSAWKLEKERLIKVKKSFWSLHNEMLLFQLIQLGLVLAIGFFLGLQPMFLFVLGAVAGFMQLETVNYIEHYGLQRKMKGDRYERTLPIHSWNSNHPLGRLVLLELSRHSDHHYMASRPYQVLRHFDESPQMPTGYPGMMLMALVPPIWFKVMHQKIDRYKESLEGQHLAK